MSEFANCPKCNQPRQEGRKCPACGTIYAEAESSQTRPGSFSVIKKQDQSFRKVIIGMILLLAVAAVGTGLVHFYNSFKTAKIVFTDDFEYTDSPLNHGWKFVFPDADDNVLATTTEFAQSGKRCLRGRYTKPTNKSRVGLQYSFYKTDFQKTISPGDKLEIIVNWYDDEASKGDFTFHPGIEYIDSNGVSRTIRFSETQDRYSYLPKKKSNWEYEDFANRKKGWHEIKYTIHNNSIDLYFDGNLISKDHSHIKKLVSFQWFSNTISPNEDAVSWIDNVKFTRQNFKE